MWQLYRELNAKSKRIRRERRKNKWERGKSERGRWCSERRRICTHSLCWNESDLKQSTFWESVMCSWYGCLMGHTLVHWILFVKMFWVELSSRIKPQVNFIAADPRIFLKGLNCRVRLNPDIQYTFIKNQRNLSIDHCYCCKTSP